MTFSRSWVVGANKKFRTLVALALIATTLAISLFWFTQVRSASQNQVPLDLQSVDVHGSSDVFSAQHRENGYQLHPEHHIFRAARTVKQTWRITADLRRPDGVLKKVYLINDSFPGPTVEARSGDHIVIEVRNALGDDEHISFHWHGLAMHGANAMDGAAGITQQPIPAGGTFTYSFTIHENQHGTFWYHAHDGVHRVDGLYGGLIVHEPTDPLQQRPVEVEHLLMVGDWYHRSAKEALEFYAHPGAFGNEPVPDSILLNGAGTFNCTNAVPARPVDCELRPEGDKSPLSWDRSKRNILRVINVGAYAGFDFSVYGAALTPLAVDGGHPIDATSSQSVGSLYPGERVDLLVEPQKQDAEVNISISLDTKPFKYTNPALTPIHYYPLSWIGESPNVTTAAELDLSHCDLTNVKSQYVQSSAIPKQPSQTIMLYALTQKLSHLDNVPHGFINHTYWEPQATPLIVLGRDQWNQNQFVPHIPYGPDPFWIDIVLNNLDEEGHPFHLHGYDFWVLSTYSSTFNWGSYNPFEDDEKPGGEYDLERAVKKDTVYVPRRGYAVLRFRADNPGIWMFHCHVIWHQASGMAMAFEVS